MRVEGLQVPSHLAERSRQILKYGDPSILATANQIRSVVQALRMVVEEVNEVQLKDAEGSISLGYSRDMGKPLMWVQFGPVGSQLPTYAFRPRGSRMRVFCPDFNYEKIILGKPVSLDRKLRRRTLEALASGGIIDIK